MTNILSGFGVSLLISLDFQPNKKENIMSTRAIVIIQDAKTGNQEEDKWNENYSLYCHGDGYPSYLGNLIEKCLDVAVLVDVNFHKPEGDTYQLIEKKDPRLPSWATNPGYGFPNAAGEACKLSAFLCGYMMLNGYSGCYLTTRDPFKEERTDIEHVYIIEVFHGAKPPKLTWHERLWKNNKGSWQKRSRNKFLEACAESPNFTPTP
jgi:hypothetical protein